MEDEYEVVMSDLSREIERDGKTVQIDIYADGDGGWILEAVDEGNNSTVWTEPFSTEQAALDEVLRFIDSEGIDELIGPPSECAQ